MKNILGKRFIAILVVIMLVTALFPMSAMAAEELPNGVGMEEIQLPEEVPEPLPEVPEAPEEEPLPEENLDETIITEEEAVEELPEADTAAEPVAAVGGNTYETLQEAFNNVAAGQTITVLRNIDLKSNWIKFGSASTTVTLDLNGFDIISSHMAIELYNDAGLNIVDSSYNNSGLIKAVLSAIDNTTSGTVTVSGGKLQSTNWHTIENEAAGTINITGNANISPSYYATIVNESKGTIVVSGNSTVSTNASAAIYNENNGYVIVNGGTVKSVTPGGRAIGNNSYAGSVSIKGGNIIAQASNGVAIKNSGNLEISGGAIKALTITGTAIRNEGGNINITGGAIAADDGEAIYISNGTVKMSGNPVVTSARRSTISDDSGTIRITGGGHLETTGGTIKNTASPEGWSIYAYGYYSYKISGTNYGRIYPSYIVTFNSMGGSAVNPSYVWKDASDKRISKPADPTKTGMQFDGWHKANDYKTAWNFGKDEVKADITLYAKWKKAVAPTEIHVDGKDPAAIENAINKIDDGGKIILDESINIGTRAITINRAGSATLDLNGFDLTYNGSGSAIAMNGSYNLSIVNSKTSASAFKATGNPNSLVLASGADSVFISGVAISAPTATRAILQNGGTGTISVRGNIVSNGAPAILNSGRGTINIYSGNIKNGSLNGTDKYAVENTGGGTVNIKGGKIEGSADSAVKNSNSMLNISGGTVKGVQNTGTIQNGSGKSVEMCKVIFTRETSNAAISSLTLSPAYTYGISDVSADANEAIYIWLPKGNAYKSIKIKRGTITYSGTIKENVASLRPDTELTSVKITGATKVYIGQKIQLKAVGNPSTAKFTYEFYISDANSSKASITKAGLLTAKSKGVINVYLKATSKYGTEKTASMKVTIKKPTTSFKLKSKEGRNTLYKGGNNLPWFTQLQITGAKPTDANKAVTDMKWTSSNTKIATVSNGMVKVASGKGTKAGTVTITAVDRGNPKSKATFKIKIVQK